MFDTKHNNLMTSMHHYISTLTIDNLLVFFYDLQLTHPNENKRLTIMP